MASDPLGISEQGQAPGDLTTDFLGVKVPISFRGQPALPTTAGGPGAAAPPTPGGGGIVPAPKGPGSTPQPGTAFGDLANAIIPDTGGGAGEGGGTGINVPAGMEGGAIPGLDLATLGLGEHGLFGTAGPFSFGEKSTPNIQSRLGASSLGPNIETGKGAFADTAVNSVISWASKALGVSLPSLLSMLSPALSALAGPAGLVLGFPALVNSVMQLTSASGLTSPSLSQQFQSLATNIATAQTPDEAEAFLGQWHDLAQSLQPFGGKFSPGQLGLAGSFNITNPETQGFSSSKSPTGFFDVAGKPLGEGKFSDLASLILEEQAVTPDPHDITQGSGGQNAPAGPTDTGMSAESSPGDPY